MTKKQKFPYLLGSKWTAQQKVDGWRHFQVVNRKNQGKWVYAELASACDPSVRFWLNAKLLQDSSQFFCIKNTQIRGYKMFKMIVISIYSFFQNK